MLDYIKAFQGGVINWEQLLGIAYVKDCRVEQVSLGVVVTNKNGIFHLVKKG